MNNYYLASSSETEFLYIVNAQHNTKEYNDFPLIESHCCAFLSSLSQLLLLFY